MINFEELNQLIAKAKAENPIANAAATHIENRTAQMRTDQISIQKKIQEDYKDSNSVHAEQSGETLTKQVLQYLELEKINMLKFSQATHPSEKPQIKINKMFLIMDRTIKAIKDPKYLLGPSYNQEFFDNSEILIPYFAEGKQIKFPDYEWNYPILGTDTFWGSNRATIFSNVLLSIRFTTTEETVTDYMNTSIAHVSDSKLLPPDFLVSQSKYLYNVNGVTGFGFTTGGYAFGGSRAETLLTHKIFTPEDCSTFIAKITGSKIPYTTLDQLYAWRFLSNVGVVNKNWPKSISEEFHGYTALETTEKPIAGDIHLQRNFKITENSNPDLEDGIAGHTTIVIGQDPKEEHKVLTFGFSRDMEKENPEEGIWGKAVAGIESYSTIYDAKETNKGTRTMFLRKTI